MSTLKDIAEDLRGEVEAYLRENIVGQVSSSETLAKTQALAIEAYSRMLGVPPDKVELINLRFEDEGRVITFDGIRLLPPVVIDVMFKLP